MLALFDAYEIRARLAPTLLVLLPLAAPAALALDAFELSLAQTGLSTLALLLMSYGASFVVRHAGRTREAQLWASWGGPPSTLVILSDRDETFSPDLRQHLLASLEAHFGVHVDLASPDVAAQQVTDSFMLVRRRIHQLDPTGLWTKHNAEYGFLRNLWGSARLWLGTDAVATVLCAAMWRFHVSPWAPLASVTCGIGLLGIWLVADRALPSVVRTAAYRYAESAWVSFLHLESRGN